ncbi:MAG: hypothetical protein U5R30_15270 [Deltaproteobacteria bacterium]|nr:hypothetical protein [Deltaproteobacteria bacterium]
MTQYEYDALGNKIRFVNALGNAFTYQYDALSRLILDADDYKYEYDTVGNLTRRIDAKNQAVNYSYDNLNRLVQITYPDSSTIDLSYDANGNLLTMTDALGTTASTFDSLNRLTERADPFGKVVGVGYDAAGNRVSLTYPDSTVVSYA